MNKNIVILLAVSFLARLSDAQDNASSKPDRPTEAHFQHPTAKDPLERLQQMIAANDALIAKQRECLAQLATLALKAKADRASAARSSH